MCEVLEEMRQCYKVRNFASLLALIEEAQSMGNRMEAALEDKNDISRWTDERSALHSEIKQLRKQKASLQSDTGQEVTDRYRL